MIALPVFFENICNEQVQMVKDTVKIVGYNDVWNIEELMGQLPEDFGQQGL